MLQLQYIKMLTTHAYDNCVKTLFSEQVLYEYHSLCCDDRTLESRPIVTARANWGRFISSHFSLTFRGQHI